MFANRFRNNSLVGPIGPQSPIKGMEIHSHFSGPIGIYHPVSFMDYKAIRPFVSVLFMLRCPAAIVRSVIAIIVNSVNLVFCAWRHAHVINKHFKRMSPFVTDFNTAPAVILISDAVGVCASIYDGGPGSKFSGMRFPMSNIAALKKFFIKASTTFGVPGIERRRSKDGFITAVAFTKPIGAAFNMVQFQYGEPGISLAG